MQPQAPNLTRAESLEKQISLPEQWGLGERLVPDALADDSASRSILDDHLARYRRVARRAAGKVVLDMACGSGYGSKFLKEAGASSVVGVDLNGSAIEYAKVRYPCPGVEFICADATTFQSPHTFDLIACFETIEHVPDPLAFARNLRSLLKEEGELFLSLPLGETRHIDPYHLHAFSQEDIFSLLDAAGFEVNLYRLDKTFLSRQNLAEWEKVYPDAIQPSLRELLFTARGRRVMVDLLIRGGFQLDELLIHAYPKSGAA
jgi:2-polyprenyl-3-methyl-5-hydroxy-6-metoxy-1,4-benzoquinol methylase